MNDWQWRTDLAASETRYKEAMLVMQSDLARGAPQAGADRAQVEYLRSEAARARSRLDSAQLRSPITGIVVTPTLQNAAGEHLDAGAAIRAGPRPFIGGGRHFSSSARRGFASARPSRRD